MTSEEFNALVRSTPNKNKAIKTDRNKLAGLLAEGVTVFIYRGGKNLNIKDTRPAFYNARFIIKPKNK